jgi:hypothetical protein
MGGSAPTGCHPQNYKSTQVWLRKVSLNCQEECEEKPNSLGVRRSALYHDIEMRNKFLIKGLRHSEIFE